MIVVDDARSLAERWAQFRFSVIGELLTAPPPAGALKVALEARAKKLWTHPISGEQKRFEFSTIESWYYAARSAIDPVVVLRKKVRCDKGMQPKVTNEQREFLRRQYEDHPGWTVQLHYDNLVAAAVKEAKLCPVSSYASVRRFMRTANLHRQKKVRGAKTAGERAAQARLETREVRSYEVDRPSALWHLDFHHCSRQVLLPSGEWDTPLLLGVLDDHSRLACHLQWYLDETTQALVHGVTQAILKHDRPGGLMSDNGSAMLSSEFTQGLMRLSIHHDLTLPHSTYQNAKQENFWGNQIEGRLMPMLEGIPDLTLEQLNKATLAWMEIEYNRHYHSEIRQTPLERYLAGQDASRPAPQPEQIRFAFTAADSRRQRASDGTISIKGRRFEIPSRFRTSSKSDCATPAGTSAASFWSIPITTSRSHRCTPSTSSPTPVASAAASRRQTPLRQSPHPAEWRRCSRNSWRSTRSRDCPPRTSPSLLRRMTNEPQTASDQPRREMEPLLSRRARRGALGSTPHRAVLLAPRIPGP